MKFFTYLGSLIPQFTLKRIVSQVTATQQELTECTLPPLRSAVEVLGNGAISTKHGRAYNQQFRKDIGYRYNGNYLNAIETALTTASDNVPVLRKAVERNFATDVTREGLNVIRVNLLQYLETLNFVSEYTRRFTSYVLNEGLKEKNAAGYINLPPAELEYIAQYLDAYIQSLNSICVKPEELERTLRQLPAINITAENADSVEAITSAAKIDPMGFSHIGPFPNPIFWRAMRVAESQHAQYHTAQEESTRLKLQIRAWEIEVQKEEVSPEEKAKLEKAIAYTQGRVNNYQYQLHKLIGEE